jgi:hypothetical protein
MVQSRVTVTQYPENQTSTTRPHSTMPERIYDISRIPRGVKIGPPKATDETQGGKGAESTNFVRTPPFVISNTGQVSDKPSDTADKPSGTANKP